MERKRSSPVMPAFMVSAPGKVIAFGEHAVVHGKVCTIAEGCNKWQALIVGTASHCSCDIITIIFPSLCTLEVETNDIPTFP